MSTASTPPEADEARPAVTRLSPRARQGYGNGFLVIAAIFATTALEAPWYFVDDRDVSEVRELGVTGVRPIHPDDVHIGAPWRWFGISCLWYVAAAWALAGVVVIVHARRVMGQSR